MKARNLLVLVSIVAYVHFSFGSFIGGEIRYEPTTTAFRYTVEVRLTCALSGPTDLPEILLDFGDGTSEIVPRTSIVDNVSAETCDGGSRLSEYIIEHMFPGFGAYTIAMTGIGRGGGILNIPSSIGQSACFPALLVIEEGVTPNSSIRFNSPPTNVFRNWNTLIHEPESVDPDGDEMQFELVTPLGQACGPIEGYEFPTGSNFIWLDPESGRLLWDYPVIFGEWSIAIRGSEYRNGLLIGQVTRDMIICITSFVAGMDEPVQVQQFSIRSNMTDQFIRIRNNTNAALATEVISTSGAVQFRTTLPLGEHPLDLGQLAQGVYMIRTHTRNGLSQTAKVVKY